MHISAVTICHQYSDYLVWSLPSARNIFDSLIVVTSKDDKETKRVCDYFWVQCIQTDLMTKNGKFNKGIGINLGLDVIDPKDYIVHYDSDIVFPPRFNEFIRCKKFDKDCLYGVDRLSVKDWDTWISFCQNPVPMHYIGSLWSNFPIMYRCVQGYQYQPIGYFQLWNVNGKYNRRYPETSDDAAGSDLDFANSWPEEKRILIPEVYVYHLESEKSNIGANWRGRKTKKFGPKESNQ